MVTSFFTGVYAIVFIFLSIYVIKGRWLNKILIGDNGNEDMLRRIRAHSNFLEYTIFFIILFSLVNNKIRAHIWRMLGTILSFTGILILALFDIYYSLHSLIVR